MRNNLLSWACAAAISLSILASCNSNSTEYLAVTEDGDSWGVIKSDGEVVFADEFDSQISAPRHGIFSVEENGNYTIYKLDKKPKPLKGCEDLPYVGFCYDTDLLPICRANERITVINTNGDTKFILEPVNGKEIINSDVAFYNGLLLMLDEDSHEGAIDESGKVAIKPRYDCIGRFFDDYSWANKDEKYYIIDKKGEEKLKIKSNYVPKSPVKHGLLLLSDDDRYGFLDVKSGDIKKCPRSVVSVDDFTKSLYVFYDGDKYGIMSMDGDKLVSAKYSSISILKDGNSFLACKGDDYMIIDKEGEKKVDLSDYDYVSDSGVENQILVAREGKSCFLINAEGKKFGKNEYDNIKASPMMSSFIKSCFVDIDGIASKAVALIDQSSIAAVTLGSTPSKYLGPDPSSYTYTYRFEPDVTLPKGYNYDMTLSAYTDSSIARYDYYDGYYFVPDCKVTSLVLAIDLPSEEGTKEAVMEKIENLLAAKGFKKDGKDGDDVVMKSGTSIIKLTPSYSSLKIDLSKEG